MTEAGAELISMLVINTGVVYLTANMKNSSAYLAVTAASEPRECQGQPVPTPRHLERWRGMNRRPKGISYYRTVSTRVIRRLDHLHELRKGILLNSFPTMESSTFIDAG